MNGCGKDLKRVFVCNKAGLCVCREPAHECGLTCEVSLEFFEVQCGSALFEGVSYLCKECCVTSGVIW
jgi:hypothetical protein